MARLALLWKVAMLIIETAGVQAAGSPHVDTDSNCLLQLAVEDVARNAASVGGANASDLYDLALLAAHTGNRTNMTLAAFAELGWEEGLIVNFNSGLDQALTFYKNGTCLITFSAVNDNLDTMQVMAGAASTTEICDHTVHAGTAQELQGFMAAPGFDDVVEFMNQARCTEAVAAGASLGGTIAGLWAACAGRLPALGNRTDYRLVMFGNFPFSTTPLTNAANASFEGTRYAITEPDGGASRYAGIRGDFRTFALDSLEALSDFLVAKNMGAFYVETVENLITALNSTPSPQFEALWESTQPQVAPLWLSVFGEVSQNPSSPAAQPALAFLMSRMPTGILTFEYDAVPVITYPFGFVHPLINFQPLPNPLKEVGGASMDMVPAEDATELPKAEFVQAGFAILAAQGWFPNHDTCCYVDMGNGQCEQMYTTGPNGTLLRSCFNTTLAFLSPAPADDQSSVVGDPHVVNVAHEKFELRAEGVHKLVQIPRFITSNVKPDLRVDAEIQHLDGCDKSFMTSLSILGRWTEDAFGLVRISPGSDMPNTTLLVNTEGPDEFFKLPRPGVQALRTSVMFKLRDVGFHVAKHFEGRYGKQRAYLNVRIAGLRKYEDLGGLLGYDGHEDAEKPSAGCTAAPPPAANRGSLIGGRSVPSTDGGSRIEAE